MRLLRIDTGQHVYIEVVDLEHKHVVRWMHRKVHCRRPSFSFVGAGKIAKARAFRRYGRVL
jgi:hypothetical protein